MHIVLHPLDQVLSAEPGTALQDVLFQQGVEFPCGGQGRCRGCRVKVLAGTLPSQPEDRLAFTQAELAQGWRLACRARVTSGLRLELAQWETPILSDDTTFAFTPRPGLGVAIDLGTTTLVAQLLDLQTGRVLAVRTALNAQAQFGADVVSRIEFALPEGGQQKLQSLIREQVGRLAADLLKSAQGSAGLSDIVIVGNTVMHHFFCGLSVEPLSHAPFTPQVTGLQQFSAADLRWGLPQDAVIRFLPCLGSFVGSDLLAGILATRLHESPRLSALVDLGTNGEIVLGNRDRILCASTAAGPAFEGARISMGMRAATGAISAVHFSGERFECHVLGDAPPRGICGSGLVDAVAAGLDSGCIAASGKFTMPGPLRLSAPVCLTQADVRELQLAKGAIAAGLRILLEHWGAKPSDLERIYLAGAFGNYINVASARRIGLLNYAPDKIQAAGNTALLGTKLALFNLIEDSGTYSDLLAKVTHLPLNEDGRFQEVFVEELSFPPVQEQPAI